MNLNICQMLRAAHRIRCVKSEQTLGSIYILASNKIRRAVEVRVSWSGRLVESYDYLKNPDIIQQNLDTAVQMISTLGNPDESERNYYLWENVEINNVKNFLRGVETFDSLKSASPANLLRFIELNERYNELSSWSVAIISKERTATRFNNANLNIGLIRRTQDHDKSSDELYYIRKSHIISPGDEFIDLSEEERQEALNRTQQLWTAAGKAGVPSYPSGEVVRNTTRKPNRPLLLIYLLDPVGARINNQTPIVGYAISFPANDRDDAVSFAVHEQLLNQFNQQDDVEIVQQDDDED